jgi:hypothetical protein
VASSSFARRITLNIKISVAELRDRHRCSLANVQRRRLTCSNASMSLRRAHGTEIANMEDLNRGARLHRNDLSK